MLGLLSCAVFTTPAAGQLAAPDPDDAMLFDIRLDSLRMGNGARGYQLENGICVDFSDVASALDVAVQIQDGGASAAGWVFDEHNLLQVDRAGGQVKLRGRTRPLQVGSIVEANGGWCVLTDVLADWLGVTIGIDSFNAVLEVGSEKPLPAQQALARQAQAHLLQSQTALSEQDDAPVRQIVIPYKVWRTPSFDITAEMGRDESEFTHGYEVFSAGEIAWMSAEARLASDRKGRVNALRARLYRSDPDGQILGGVKATELAIGDVSSFPTRLVSQSASGRGMSITNRPLEQASQFDTVDFRGDLPVGWDVELYRNGELMALSRAHSQGRYEFLTVPLVYGTNRFEIVKHGPQGQIRREKRIYEVGANAVPSGSLWWWAGAVEKNQDLLGLLSGSKDPGRWRMGAGFEYGLDKRTSTALSVHRLALKTGDHSFVEANLRRAIGPMTLSASGAVDEERHRAVTVSGLGKAAGFRFGFTALTNQGLQSDQLNEATRSSLAFNLDRDLSIGTLSLPTRFDLEMQRHTDGGRAQDMSVRTSFSIAGISTSVAAKLARTALPQQDYGPLEGGGAMLFSARLGKMGLRGEVNYRLGSHCAVSDMRLTSLWSFSARDTWQASVVYSLQNERAGYSFSYYHKFDRFALSATTSGETGGGISARLGLQFSLGSDARGRLNRISSDRLASSGTAAIAIYRDEDGDAVRQADEPLERTARVRMAGQTVGTPLAPSAKHLILNGLAPGSAVILGVDPVSLPDPMLNPVEQAIRIVPRKGLEIAIDLAVAAYGLLEGDFAYADGEPAANILVVLKDMAGREVARVLTDFDGSFIFEKIPYGKYRLEPAAQAQLKNDQSLQVVLNAHKSSLNLSSMIVDRPTPSRNAVVIVALREHTKE